MLAYTSKAELEFYVIETEMKNAEVGLKQKCKAWSLNLNFNTFWNKILKFQSEEDDDREFKADTVCVPTGTLHQLSRACSKPLKATQRVRLL